MEPSRYKDKLSTHVLGKKRRILGSEVDGRGNHYRFVNMIQTIINILFPPSSSVDDEASVDKKKTTV